MIRAGLPVAVTPPRTFSRINGLSPRSHRAVAQVEVRRLGPRSLEWALAGYREFLDRPGRWLYLPENRGDFDDPCYCRDVLEVALLHLPPTARAELRRLVTPLDTRFRARTLPDPAPPPWWYAGRWWCQRL